MATTQVILKQNIPGLGAEADVVKVKAGFARNYLVPGDKAYFLTPGNLRKLSNLKAKRAEREAAELNQAETLARKINKLKLKMELATGQGGKAFGSITTHDISARLMSELGGIEIDHHKVQLERPIKTTGTHEVPVKLHPQVTATATVIVESAGKAESKAPAEDASE